MTIPPISGEIQYVTPDGKLTFLGIALLQDIATGIESGGGAAIWGAILGSITDQIDLVAALAGKSSVTHNHSYPTLNDLPTLGTAAAADVGDFAAALHGHTQAEVLDLVADLAAKQAALVSGTNIKTINGATILGSGDLVVSGTDPLNLATSGPAAPAADIVRVSRFSRSKQHTIAMRGLNGQTRAVQQSLFYNRVGIWLPAAGVATVPAVVGFPALTITGTATARIPATTNRFTRGSRLGYVSAATAGSVTTQRHAQPSIYVGSGSEDGTGFFWACRFGIADAAAVSDARMFVGLRDTGAVSSGPEPSTLVGCIGIGHGAADTNLKIFYGGSAAQTPVDLGANFPSNTLSTDIYDLTLHAPHDVANTVYWEVVRVNTGHVASGTITGAATIMPQSGTLLAVNCFRGNNATALAVGIDYFRIYLETMD